MVDQFNQYIYQKRGFYYFSRRVPKELHHCHAKHRIVLALNTRSRAKALKYAQVICQRLDERWLPMRLDALGLGNVIANDVRVISAPTLSEATQQYLQLKGMGKAKTFHQAALRNAGTVIEICGDRVVTEYRTTDAGKVRDVLIDRGLNVLSVRRSFTTIKAIINLAIAEHGLDMRNPFSSIFMPEADSKKVTNVGVVSDEVYTEEQLSNLSAQLEIHSNGNVNLNTKFVESVYIADEIDEFGSYTNFFARNVSSKSKETGEIFYSNAYTGIEQLLSFSSFDLEGILSSTILNIVSQNTKVRFYQCSKL